MDVVVRCAKALYKKRNGVNITEHLSFVKWLVLSADFCGLVYSWYANFFGKSATMWCLISQANFVVFEVRCDPKAIGQECLEKVRFFLLFENTLKFFVMASWFLFVNNASFLSWLAVFLSTATLPFCHGFFFCQQRSFFVVCFVMATCFFLFVSNAFLS